jgi:Family of unknown function (DUF6962)
VTLLEPDVALTDFGLTIECLALAAWLHWRTPMNPLRTWFVIFFAALGIAALLGGITHGFLDDPRSTLYGLTWSATLLAIGIAAVATWTIGARLLFSERTAKRVLVVAGLLFIVYAATILWISRSFTVAIVTYVPAVAFLLLAFALTYRRRPSSYLIPTRGLADSLGLPKSSRVRIDGGEGEIRHATGAYTSRRL